ncbi:MAG: TRAP transporter large permease [Lachnospiraceae bacterium]|jgi:C4-dicarboxylate transporter DctM subunit|nr:TRAP transporter large permease [Lachnospiraceae bacterium]
MNPGLIIFIVFMVCVFLGVPIVFSLGIASMVGIVAFEIVPMSYYIQVLYAGSDSFTLLAVPFFILVGEILCIGGIAERLVSFANTIFGRTSGSLGYITVFVCAIFAAISGSGVATVAAVGGIMVPAMIREKYDKNYAGALAASSATLGPIIPPSLPMVMYGITAGVSITKLFTAGIGPGLLMTLSLMLLNFAVSKKHHFQPAKREGKFDWRALGKEFLSAIWGLLVPIIILGGIYGGIFTPTEAAVVACVWGLFVSVFIYREMDLKKFIQCLNNTVKTTGMCLIMASIALAFGRVLTLMGVPNAIAGAITSITSSRIVILLLFNVILFIAGMFLETLAAVFIFTPLLLPIAQSVGVDPIHFGLIMCVNLAIGLVTPPVGLNLFIASKLADTKMEALLGWVMKFIVILIIDLMLITFVPQLTLFLVS